MTLPINFECLAEFIQTTERGEAVVMCLSFFSFIIGACGIMIVLNYFIFAGPIKSLYEMYKDLLSGFSIAGGIVIGFFFSLIYILFYIAILLVVIGAGFPVWINIFEKIITFFTTHSYTII